MERQPRFDAHPTEGVLEEYWFKRLPDSAEEEVEEHLLICPRCQDALEELQDYILLIKAATLERQQASKRAQRTPADRTWEQVKKPGPQLVIGLAMAAMAVALIWNPTPAWTPASTIPVQLSALRGSDDATANRAAARRPLDLAIDVTDLPEYKAYRLELVDASGRRIWDTSASPSNGRLSAKIPKGLPPGTYWVRLYSGPGTLLREFGLSLS